MKLYMWAKKVVSLFFYNDFVRKPLTFYHQIIINLINCQSAKKTCQFFSNLPSSKSPLPVQKHIIINSLYQIKKY